MTYKKARGVLKCDEPAEIIIRRIRDGESVTDMQPEPAHYPGCWRVHHSCATKLIERIAKELKLEHKIDMFPPIAITRQKLWLEEAGEDGIK